MDNLCNFSLQGISIVGPSNAEPLPRPPSPAMYQLDIILKKGNNLAIRDRTGSSCTSSSSVLPVTLPMLRFMYMWRDRANSFNKAPSSPPDECYPGLCPPFTIVLLLAQAVRHSGYYFLQRIQLFQVKFHGYYFFCSAILEQSHPFLFSMQYFFPCVFTFTLISPYILLPFLSHLSARVVLLNHKSRPHSHVWSKIELRGVMPHILCASRHERKSGLA